MDGECHESAEGFVADLRIVEVVIGHEMAAVDAVL